MAWYQQENKIDIFNSGTTGVISMQNLSTEAIWASNLRNFRQHGRWDVQRLFVTNGIDHDLRDISTINIGIYAAAAGMALKEILNIENNYASRSSSFYWKLDKPDPIYTHIPIRNVENTKIGYYLYKKGLITGY